jgi:hypothetical protein
MQLNLTPHPSTQPSDPELKVWASVDHSGALGGTATTNLWFGIGAPASRFVIREGEDERTDELWRTTCFEAFLAAPGYREGMRNADVPHSPYIRMEDNLTWWAVGATIAVDAGAEWRLGLSAVLEEKGGTKSYWALAHGSEKPDFHDPACFAARLA